MLYFNRTLNIIKADLEPLYLLILIYIYPGDWGDRLEGGKIRVEQWNEFSILKGGDGKFWWLSVN